MERRWQVPIAWVEYVYRAGARGGIRDPKNTYRAVDYDTASRRGEPFAMLIRAHKILPNAHKREIRNPWQRERPGAASHSQVIENAC